MKKPILLLLLLSFAGSTNAQLFTIFGHEVGYIHVGPRVGTNFTKLNRWSYDDGYEMQNKFGYQLGVVGEFGFTTRFSIQSEIVFISRGTSKVWTGTTGGMDSKMKTSSIAIPLLAKYSFKLLGLKKVYAVGGTYATVKTGGTEILEDGSEYSDYHWSTMDWGLSFGCGAEYPTKDGIWGLDIRYDLGLVDVYRQMDETTKSQFRSLNLTLTYKFDVVDLLFKTKGKKKGNSGDAELDSNKRVKGLKVE